MDACTREIGKLQEQYGELDAQMALCDAAKAAALARSYELDKELAAEKVSRESTEVRG